jgi:hypothetical protein
MWTIAAVGTREGVIKEIQAAKPTPPEADAAQLESIKPLLVAEVNGLDAEFNGARLSASGDALKTSRNVTVQLVGIKLHL